MDITTLFKACVKTVLTTNKSLGVKNQNTNLLRKSRKDVNLDKAREIVKQLTNLQNVFLENKAAYLNVLNYLSTNKTMTEFDRQHIDSLAETVIGNCTNLINGYKKEMVAVQKTKQIEEHYGTVIESLERYLRTVSKTYAEAKAVRVKRVIETHKLSKLEIPSSKVDLEVKKNIRKAALNDRTDVTFRKTDISPIQSSPVTYDDELSAEEVQIFEAENELLYNELNSMSDEVRQIENKVVHIAELQELFTEKVLQQDQDIERIATHVVGSTENMKDANEQIRQAIQRNAGLRVWVLFFLLVMSFSLLFLDWYND